MDQTKISDPTNWSMERMARPKKQTLGGEVLFTDLGSMRIDRPNASIEGNDCRSHA
jgi:hypothetical protein